MAKKPTYDELKAQIAVLKKDVAAYKRERKALKQSESSLRGFFESSPTAQIEMDCSKLKQHFDALEKSGVTDFNAYLAEDKDAVAACVDKVKLIQINNAALKLFGTDSLGKYKRHSNQIIVDDDGLDTVVRGLAAMAEGKTAYADERAFNPVVGDPIYVRVNWQVLPGCEKTLSRVYISYTDITDRKLMEEKLTKNEAHLSNAQKAARIGSWEWDFITGDVYGSDEIYRIYGLSTQSDKLTQKHIDQTIHPDDRERIHKEIRDAISGESPWEMESRIALRDGSIRHLFVRAKVYRNDEGKAVRALGVAFDITGLKALQEQHRIRIAHEKMTRSLTEIGTTVWDLNADTVTWSDEIYRLLGLAVDSDKLTIDYYRDAVHPKDLERVEKAYLSLTESDHRFSIEYRVKRADGAIRWIKVYAVMIPDSEGNPSKILHSWLDITDRVLREKALQESESRFRSLFDNSPVALIEVDCTALKTYFSELSASGVKDFKNFFNKHPDDAARSGLLVKAIHANQAAVDELNAETREILLDGFSGLGGDVFLKYWIDIAAALAEGRTEFEIDARYYTFKGDIRDFSFQWTVPEDSRTTLDKVYIAAVDITNRKRLERALKRSEAKLQRKALKLETTNTAMDVLLEKRLADKKDLEENMIYNVRELILPYLKKIKGNGLDTRQKTYISILERNLDNIMSPFLKSVSLGQLKFTPSELQVVQLLKEGMSTKQMADFFNLSPRTIESYRDNIREKLGLKKKKMNLRTYLMTKG